MDSCRFVVDEQSFDFSGIDPAVATASLETLAAELARLRSDGEQVSILSGWGAIPSLDGSDLSWLLASSGLIPRDLGAHLLSLLDKCIAWDEAADVVVDPAVEIDGNSLESYGVAWAAECQSKGYAIAVISLAHCPYQGIQQVKYGHLQVSIHFVVRESDYPPFYRSICSASRVDEAAFFGIAQKAFPNLRFAEGIDFRRLDGTYHHLLPSVVHHLGVLNDQFMDAYRGEMGHSARISTRIGIDVSIEGSQTRASESLMKQRDAIFDHQIFRCEWHSKIEPHRNRIHFFPPSHGEIIVVGLFVDHLDT